MKKKPATAGLAIVFAAAALVSTGTGAAQAKNNCWVLGAVAAGSFVAGAVIGSTLSEPRYYAPPPAYAEPASVYYVGPAPWTAEWYRYCSTRYRTFNPDSGYYLYRPGQARFCQ